MREHKEILRKQLRVRRQMLSTADVAGLSQHIARNAIGAIDWTSITSLHIYQPIRQQREVDTTPFLQTIWQRHPRIRTATWQKTSDGYEARWLNAAGSVVPISPGQQFDAIMVPLLGFNDARHRIGFGGGFYDRFLAKQPDAVTIGLCYELGYIASFRPEAHDIPLVHIVTEKQIYSQRR